MWSSLEGKEETKPNKDEGWSWPPQVQEDTDQHLWSANCPGEHGCGPSSHMVAIVDEHNRKEEQENSELLQMSVCKEEQGDKTG